MKQKAKRIFLKLGCILLILIVKYLTIKYDFDINSIFEILLISCNSLLKIDLKLKRNKIIYNFKILVLWKKKTK